jgi:hypothetical protein
MNKDYNGTISCILEVFDYSISNWRNDWFNFRYLVCYLNSLVIVIICM